MKIMNLIKSEFIKNYSIKRFLVIILLLIGTSLFIVNCTNTLIDEYNSYNPVDALEGSIESFQRGLSQMRQKNDKTFEDEYDIYYYQKYIFYMTKVRDIGITSDSDFKELLVQQDLIPLLKQNYLIENINHEEGRSYIKDSCSSDNEYELKYRKDIKGLCDNKSTKELRELYEKNKSQIQDYENLLEENKFYLYIEYQINQNVIKKTPFTDLIIQKRIENPSESEEKNYLQYKALEENENITVMSEEEYNKENKNKDKDNKISYHEYLSYHTKLKENAKAFRQILLYSTKHGIKHDISYNYHDNISESQMVQNPKLKVNQVYHLSSLIILIIAVTNSGIISNEHSRGTIKNIITAPVKRWKILISKFIYLILDMYVIWFLGLFILSLCTGMKYGFAELLTPKLLYTGEKVIEVNYYLSIIKNIFIASIPVISFLSILFFLSTVTLNTSLTVGISSVLGVLSSLVWLLDMVGLVRGIVYTPLWYLDSGFLLNNSERYISSLEKISYSMSTGIIVSIITIIMIYLVTNIIYIKRDIKN